MKTKQTVVFALAAIIPICAALTGCGGGTTNITNNYNFPPGCTSTSGTSTTTGQNCDGTGGGGNTEAPTCDMTADHDTVAPGSSSVVTITSTNSPTSTDVQPGVGAPNQDNTFTVTPSATTTYTTTVANSAGSNTCQITVTVADTSSEPGLNTGASDNTWTTDPFSMSGYTGSVTQDYPSTRTNGATAAVVEYTVESDLNKNGVLDAEDKANDVGITLAPQWGAAAKAKPKNMNLKAYAKNYATGILHNGVATISVQLDHPDTSFSLFLQVDCMGQPASVRMHITKVVVTSGSGTSTLDPNGWGPQINCTP